MIRGMNLALAQCSSGSVAAAAVVSSVRLSAAVAVEAVAAASKARLLAAAAVEAAAWTAKSSAGLRVQSGQGSAEQPRCR